MPLHETLYIPLSAGSGWAVGESLPFPIRDRANTSPSTNSARISSMTQSTLLPGLNIGDAQNLPNLWGDLPSPRAILTSPPYLDIHDYGNASRIGARGQALDEYLVQMLKLFSGCYRIASADATLWLVAGAIRRNKRLIMLPDRLASCAEEAGWNLRESITWDKQKALPWTHHGELRDITEQLLLFSKAEDFRFDPTDLRSPLPNSVWWRRYPERYSPDGAMPTNLWSIPIPTQGSWSGTRTHFCPFPEELTYRMLSLTTAEGDTVLDPLAGIGSVPAMAEAMGRVGYGIELTARYTELYQRTKESAREFLARLGEDSRRRKNFRQTIIELRLLKFAKLLAQQVNDAGYNLSWVRAKKSCLRPEQEHHVVVGYFELVLVDESIYEDALAAAHAAIKRPPLSKFGVEAKLVPVKLKDASTDGYWYVSGRFWKSPETERPSDGDPHVVAEFKPAPDLIDDMPYG